MKKIWFKGQDLTRPGELELLAPFGLSTNYLSKGPLKADKSVRRSLRGDPVIIPDISRSDRLQYPEAAVQEGVATTVSTPILSLQEEIGQVGKGLRYFSISKNCHTVKLCQDGVVFRYHMANSTAFIGIHSLFRLRILLFYQRPESLILLNRVPFQGVQPG